MSAARPWLAAIGSDVIVGLAVGVPYFYDSCGHPFTDGGHGWSRSEIALGLPAGTLVTLATGPLLSRRLPARAGVIGGAARCAAAVAGTVDTAPLTAEPLDAERLGRPAATLFRWSSGCLASLEAE